MITSTVAALLQEYFKTSERTVFWDDALKANVDPFQDMPGGFFAASWDLKVRPNFSLPRPCGVSPEHPSSSSRYYGN